MASAKTPKIPTFEELDAAAKATEPKAEEPSVADTEPPPADAEAVVEIPPEPPAKVFQCVVVDACNARFDGQSVFIPKATTVFWTDKIIAEATRQGVKVTLVGEVVADKVA